MASPPTSAFQTLVECPVCYRIYHKPKSLRCRHVVCEACVELIANNNRIECPVCRKSTVLELIKLDFNTQSLVDAYLKDNEEKAKQLEIEGLRLESELPTLLTADICQSCDAIRQVSSHCQECNLYICTECESQHSLCTLKPAANIIQSLKSDIGGTVSSLLCQLQVTKSKIEMVENYIEHLASLKDKKTNEISNQTAGLINEIKVIHNDNIGQFKKEINTLQTTAEQQLEYLSPIQKSIMKKVNALHYIQAELEEATDKRTIVSQSKSFYEKVKTDILDLEKTILEKAENFTLPIIVKLTPPVKPENTICCQVEIITCQQLAMRVSKDVENVKGSQLINDTDDRLINKYPLVESSVDTKSEENIITPDSNGDNDRQTVESADAETILWEANAAVGAIYLNPSNNCPVVESSVDTQIGENTPDNNGDNDSQIVASADAETQTAEQSEANATEEPVNLNPTNSQPSPTITTIDNNVIPSLNFTNGVTIGLSHVKTVSFGHHTVYTKIKEITHNMHLSHCRIYLHNNSELWCTSGTSSIKVYNLDWDILRSITLLGVTELRAIIYDSHQRIIAASLDGLHECDEDGTYVSKISDGKYVDMAEYKSVIYALEYDTSYIHCFRRRRKLLSIGHTWSLIRKINCREENLGDIYDKIQARKGWFLWVTSWFTNRHCNISRSGKIYGSAWSKAQFWYRQANQSGKGLNVRLLRTQLEDCSEIDYPAGKRDTAIMDAVVDVHGRMCWILTLNKIYKFSIQEYEN